MEQRQVIIRKVENGYVVKAITIRPVTVRNVEGMMSLMRAIGMYESWEEHKEEDIRRSLEKIAGNPNQERYEREIIFNNMQEVVSFLNEFLEKKPWENPTDISI